MARSPTTGVRWEEEEEEEGEREDAGEESAARPPKIRAKGAGEIEHVEHERLSVALCSCCRRFLSIRQTVPTKPDVASNVGMFGGGNISTFKNGSVRYVVY